MENPDFHQARKQVTDDLTRIWIKNVLVPFVGVFGLVVVLEGKKLFYGGNLRHRRLESAVGNDDPVDLSGEVAALQIASEVSSQGARLGRRRHCMCCLDRFFPPLEVLFSLATYGGEDEFSGLVLDELIEVSQEIGVISPAQTSVARDDEDQTAFLGFGHVHQRMGVWVDPLQEVGNHPFKLFGVGTGLDRGLLRTAQFCRGDHLHRFGDLLGTFDRADPFTDGLEVWH